MTLAGPHLLVFSFRNITALPEPIILEETAAEILMLSVDHNQLTQLPAHLSTLVRLDRLNASHNLIGGPIFEKNIHLPLLSQLCLQNNKLCALENCFPDFSNLRDLDLSNNQIQNISDHIFRSLSALNHLNLSNNQLVSLSSSSFSKETPLATVNLENNKLENFPQFLMDYDSLTCLNLQNNDISSPPIIFKKPSALKLLVDGNPFLLSIIIQHNIINNKMDVSNDSDSSNCGESDKEIRDTPPRSEYNSPILQQRKTFKRSQSFGVPSRSLRPRPEIARLSVITSHELFIRKEKEKKEEEEKSISEAEDESVKLQKQIKKLQKRLHTEKQRKASSLEQFKQIFNDLDKAKDKAPGIQKGHCLIRSLEGKSGKETTRSRRNTELSGKSRRKARSSVTNIFPKSSAVQATLNRTARNPTMPDLNVRVTPPPGAIELRRGKQKQYVFIRKIDALSLAFLVEEEGSFEAENSSGEEIIAGGCILDLFRYLMYHSISTENLSSFLCMYRSFVDGKELATELFVIVDAWNESKSDDLHSDATYQQICRIVQQWIEHYFIMDFWRNAAMLEQILAIISKLPDIASFRLQKLVEFKLSDCAEQNYKKPNRREPVPSIEQNHQIELLSISPLDVAQQFTLLEFSLFQEIDSAQCITSKDRNASDNPTKRMSERFNITSHWVATEIVKEKTLKKRVAVMKYFLDVGDALYDIRNYNTALAITAGLTLSPVNRLAKSWQALPKKSMEIFGKLKSLMDGHHNFQNYRSVLQSAPLPCLPYFGIFLRDLTFTDDSYDNTLANGFANFIKMKRMSSILQSILHFQSAPFQFTVQSHLYNYLQNVAALDEDALYPMSQSCEPPEQ